jgi:DNA modification methylase
MSWTIHQGDCLEVLPRLDAQSVHCVVTSPPYFGLRDYGVDGQIGLEETPAAYVAQLVNVFREVRRVLRDDGTVWLNLGDSYAGVGYSNHYNTGGAQRVEGGKQRHLVGTGTANKQLLGIPWRVAFALQDDGWILRSDIIWAKTNPMPESVKDRPTKAHEYVFLFAKQPRYYYDADAVREPHAGVSLERWGMGGEDTDNTKYDKRKPQTAVGNLRNGSNPLHPAGRNRRSVWTVSTKPYSGAHFAVFPPKLIEPCILAGCPEGGVVLDPFAGSGTTGEVSQKHGRSFVGIELNADYIQLAETRLNGQPQRLAV